VGQLRAHICFVCGMSADLQCTARAHGGNGLRAAQLAMPLGAGGVWLLASSLLIYLQTQWRLGSSRCMLCYVQALCCACATM
jgi:hypothetical protein